MSPTAPPAGALGWEICPWPLTLGGSQRPGHGAGLKQTHCSEVKTGSEIHRKQDADHTAMLGQTRPRPSSYTSPSPPPLPTRQEQRADSMFAAPRCSPASLDTTWKTRQEKGRQPDVSHSSKCMCHVCIMSICYKCYVRMLHVLGMSVVYLCAACTCVVCTCSADV